MTSQNTAKFFENVAQLLKSALHPGAHSQWVAEAITLLEQMSKDATLAEPYTGVASAVAEVAAEGVPNV